VSDTPALVLRTLGTAVLERTARDGTEIPLRASKPLALLAYLALQRGRPVSRDQAADLLWGDEAPERSRGSLRQAIHVLRRALGEAAVAGSREEIWLPRDVLTLDVVEFEGAVGRGALAEIVGWYRGPFGTRLAGREAPAFEHWALIERERLRRLLVEGVSRGFASLSAAGALGEAAALARSLVVAEPDLEPLVLLASDALVANGDFSWAREAIEGARDRELAAGDAASPALEERLARLASAERNRVQRAPTQRDTLGQRFVGRKDQLAALYQALERARLGERTRVAVVGPPGIGKSRLLDEFEARLRPKVSRLARVRFLPPMRNIPGTGAAELARALCELPGAMGIGERSAATLVAMLPELRRRFVVAPDLVAQEGDWMRLRADAIADLVASVAEDRLTVLLIDDDQYLDADSRAILGNAFARTDLRLLELRGSRTALAAADASRLFLPPLTGEEVRQLLAGEARLPDAPWVEPAVRRLAADSAGIPQVLLQRLRALQASGALVIVDGEWHTDPDRLERAAAESAPELADALGALSAEARYVLQLLAVWGRSLSESALVAIVGARGGTDATGNSTNSALNELEWRGFVAAHSPEWSVAHDTIADLVLGGITEAEGTQLLADLVRYWTSAGALTVPVLEHLALVAGSRGDRRMLGTLVRRASRNRGLRSIGLRGQILADRVATSAGHPEWGGELLRSIRWTERASRGALVALGSVAGTVLAGAIWLTVMLWPRLVVEAVPMVDGWSAFAVQPRVAVYDGFGRLRSDYTGLIRVHSPEMLVEGDTARALVGGKAQFEELVLGMRGGVPVDRDPRAHLRFSGTGRVRGVSVEVSGMVAQFAVVLQKSQFSVIKLRINGGVAGLHETHRLPVRDSLTLTLTYEFNTFAATANYIVGAQATWEPRETSAIRLAGLPRPVNNAWQTRTITLKAPDEPGLQHVLIVMAAEDHVDNIFSSTSWTVGSPVWYNGDDLVDLPLARKQELRDAFTTSATVLRATYDRREADFVFGNSRRVVVPDKRIVESQEMINGYAVELEFVENPDVFPR
jgi:DNA-binding SARP family transcriptional activator